jgi:hypothetical protein
MVTGFLSATLIVRQYLEPESLKPIRGIIQKSLLPGFKRKDRVCWVSAAANIALRLRLCAGMEFEIQKFNYLHSLLKIKCSVFIHQPYLHKTVCWQKFF